MARDEDGRTNRGWIIAGSGCDVERAARFHRGALGLSVALGARPPGAGRQDVGSRELRAYLKQEWNADIGWLLAVSRRTAPARLSSRLRAWLRAWLRARMGRTAEGRARLFRAVPCEAGQVDGVRLEGRSELRSFAERLWDDVLAAYGGAQRPRSMEGSK